MTCRRRLLGMTCRRRPLRMTCCCFRLLRMVIAGESLQHLRQEHPCIRMDRLLHMDGGLLHLSGIDIHHDHLCRPCPGTPVVPRHTNRQAVTDGQNKIRVLDRKIPRPVSHISAPSHVQGMIRFHQVDGIPVGTDRNSKKFHHPPEFLHRARQPDPVSGIDHRTFCLPELFQNILHYLRIKRFRKLHAVIILHPVKLRVTTKVFRLDHTALEIHRHIQPHRARTSCCRHIEGTLQMVADIHGVLYHGGIFAHDTRRLCDIEFLISHRPERFSRKACIISCRGIITNLTGYNEHGDGIQPSSQHAGQGIGPSGSCGHAEQSHAVCKTGIGLCRDGTGLLMMVVGAFQPRMMSEGIIQMHGSSAGHGETVRDPPLRQKIRYIIRKSYLHTIFLPCNISQDPSLWDDRGRFWDAQNRPQSSHPISSVKRKLQLPGLRHISQDPKFCHLIDHGARNLGSVLQFFL